MSALSDHAPMTDAEKAAMRARLTPEEIASIQEAVDELRYGPWANLILIPMLKHIAAQEDEIERLGREMYRAESDGDLARLRAEQAEQQVEKYGAAGYVAVLMGDGRKWCATIGEHEATWQRGEGPDVPSALRALADDWDAATGTERATAHEDTATFVDRIIRYVFGQTPRAEDVARVTKEIDGIIDAARHASAGEAVRYSDPESQSPYDASRPRDK